MEVITGQAFAGAPRPASGVLAGRTLGAGGHAARRAWGLRQPGPVYRRLLKRPLDLLVVAMVALPVLLVLLPLMALVALDGHSPFFVQARLGRGGRVFRMIKLRTMVPDAEAALEAALEADPEARAEWEHHQKLRRDPRVTRVGAILRSTSLDELPQLLNVAMGQMSLVGPRPMMPDQRALYPGQAYFEMRPGITGPWQVSVRNESSFSERAAFDGAYHAELSLETDLRLMWRTVAVVVRGTGC